MARLMSGESYMLLQVERVKKVEKTSGPRGRGVIDMEVEITRNQKVSGLGTKVSK